jgi:hypothetical protein
MARFTRTFTALDLQCAQAMSNGFKFGFFALLITSFIGAAGCGHKTPPQSTTTTRTQTTTTTDTGDNTSSDVKQTTTKQADGSSTTDTVQKSTTAAPAAK